MKRIIKSDLIPHPHEKTMKTELKKSSQWDSNLKKMLWFSNPPRYHLS